MKFFKKGIALVLAAVLMLSLASNCFAASAGDTASPMTLSVEYLTLAGVNMRSTPSLDGPIVKTLSKGTTVIYHGSSSGVWMLVIYGSVGGYIRDDLLCQKSKCYYTTASGGLNLRSGHSETASIIGQIEYNTFVEVTSWSGSDWACVTVREGKLEGRTGWVSAAYLQKYNGI